MHVPGMLGMPRRIYTYEADRGWSVWNMIVTIGVPLPGRRRCCIFVCNIAGRSAKGRMAGDDPWDAWTLEWSTTSPPPALQLRRTPTWTAAVRCGI